MWQSRDDQLEAIATTIKMIMNLKTRYTAQQARQECPLRRPLAERTLQEKRRKSCHQACRHLRGRRGRGRGVTQLTCAALLCYFFELRKIRVSDWRWGGSFHREFWLLKVLYSVQVVVEYMFVSFLNGIHHWEEVAVIILIKAILKTG